MAQPTPPMDDATMLKLADLLLNRVPQRTGILAVEDGIRVQTFRGKKLIETMLAASTPRKHGLQHVTNEDQAMELAHRMLNHVSPTTKSYLFLPAERLKDKQSGHHIYKPIAAPQHAGGRTFDKGEAGRYVWLYKGSQTRNMLWLAVLIAIVFGMCLFPLWPGAMRVAVWYISVTLLLVLLGLTLTQFLVYGVVWLFGYDFWLVPNLWSDTASIFEAFKPAYTFEKSEGSNMWYRLAGAGLLLGLLGWVASQPSEFEHFVAGQKKIVDDLYAGTLLAEAMSGGGMTSAPARSGGGYSGWQAQYGAGAYGGRRTTHAVPDLDALQKQLEEELAASATAAPGEGAAHSDASGAGGGGGEGGADLDAMLAADEAAAASEVAASEAVEVDAATGGSHEAAAAAAAAAAGA